jgi:hypothetical protein
VIQQLSSIRTTKSRGNSTLVSEAMANKTLREFSAPSTENIRTGPTLKTNNLEFELKPSLINMVQATPFSEKAHEDACAYLQNFLELVAQSLSRTLLKTSYYFVCSSSHLQEERSSGSTPTKITSIHGQNVQRPS